MYFIFEQYKDLINGSFELLASFATLDHCRVLLQDREVRGVSYFSILFFIIWGFWNLFYYPSLNQLLSYFGSIGIVIANIFYFCLVIYYKSGRNKSPA